MSKYSISNSADLDTLEKHLNTAIYIGGQNPGAEDALVFTQWTNSRTEPDQTKYPAVWTWFALISLYNLEFLNYGKSC